MPAATHEHFPSYFYKNKKSKLYFGDLVVVLNDFFYQNGGSTPSVPKYKHSSISVMHV
jgi:hypothetical protein